MIEMLKNRKEALQKRGVKGFTLMEMLIVIAIIAVLVAIAIPVLGAQLDRSKDAADEANARSAYALLQADAMSPAKKADGTYGKPTATWNGTANPKTFVVKLSNGDEQSFEFSDRTSSIAYSVEDSGEVTLDLSYGGTASGGAANQTKHFGTTETS